MQRTPVTLTAPPKDTPTKKKRAPKAKKDAEVLLGEAQTLQRYKYDFTDAKPEYIVGIDAGNNVSAACVVDVETGMIPSGLFTRCNNPDFLIWLDDILDTTATVTVAIEMIQSFGMRVGQTIFDTCLFNGILFEKCRRRGIPVVLVKRGKIKYWHCGKTATNDAGVIAALKGKYGDKGTKFSQGYFFGVKRDIWQAAAIGLYMFEKAGGVPFLYQAEEAGKQAANDRRLAAPEPIDLDGGDALDQAFGPRE